MTQIIYALGGHAYMRDGDDLFDTATGQYVGRFHGDEVYAPNGYYLGELTSGGKLGTNTSKLGKSGAAFAQLASRGATGNASHAATGIPAGWQDFKSEED